MSFSQTRIFPILTAIVLPGLVFLAVISVGYDGLPFLRGDCSYYVAASRSIATDGDLDISNQLRLPWSVHTTQVALDRNGRLVPKHPLWLSIAALPLIVAFGNQGALVFNFFQLLLLCALMFTLARRVAGRWPSALAVAATAILSFLPHYAWNFSPDVFLAALFLGALVILPPDRTPHLWKHILSGLLFGVATTAKPSYALAALALPMLFGRPLRRSMPAFIVGGMIPILLWMGLNLHLFGNPLVTPYDRIVHFTNQGVVLHSNRDDFTEPLWQGARAQMMDPRKGLLQTTPITILSLLFFPLLLKSEARWAAYLAVTSTAIYLFYSKYALWPTSSWGNRFLIPIVVLCVMPLATAFDWRRIRHLPCRQRAVTGPEQLSNPPRTQENQVL